MFANSKCKILSRDSVGPKPFLVLAAEHLFEVERFSYLGNGISPGDRLSEELYSRIRNTRSAFTCLKHSVSEAFDSWKMDRVGH